MRRINKFEEFKANEGVGKSLSTLALLVGLGLITPRQAFAEKDTTAVKSKIDERGKEVLRLLDSSAELRDSLENGTEKPIAVMLKEIECLRGEEQIDLDFERAIEKMQDPEFPIRINIFGYKRDGEDENSISTISYDINRRVTFTLTKNPMWGTSLYGFKVKF